MKNQHLPIQKCISGCEVKDLSDIELLAVIIGNGYKDKSVLSLAADVYNKLQDAVHAAQKSGQTEDNEEIKG